MFPIITIDDDAPPDFPEQLGTKEKYWFRIENQRCLFKIGRPDTGENWAEKIASELADLLGLPHAHYDLAVWKGRKGVLSPLVVPETGRLIMGNELLAVIHSGYPTLDVRHVRDHTLTRIHALLKNDVIGHPPGWKSPSDKISSAYDLFLGYLLLDTWIANQDRHHENWGLIRDQGQIYLAPSYDHAASMGQNETDAVRKDRLTTRDRGRQISSYVTKARSAIYDSKTSKKALLTLELFRKAAEKSPNAAKIWLDQLKQVSEKAVQSLFEQLPDGEITPLAKLFATKMLELNKQRLLKTQKQ
ncbi:MAG: phosphatidylinositol kinase [Candidatus Thiodiazotropha sp.]